MTIHIDIHSVEENGQVTNENETAGKKRDGSAARESVEGFTKSGSLIQSPSYSFRPNP